MVRPLARYTALYALTELLAIALLIWAFGLGWTLLIVATAFMAGVLLAGSQLKDQVARIKRGRSPRSAATDGALVGLGTALVFMPGIVTTAAGALMLTPATRASMRPLAEAMVTKGIARRIGGLTPARTDYIDGEVIDAAPVALARNAARRSALVLTR